MVAQPMTTTACVNPIAPISMTHSGANRIPPETRPVECMTQRQRSAPIEPGRYHRDDRGPTGRGPAGTAQHRGNEQLPRRHRQRPADHADHQCRNARLRHQR